MADPMAPEDVLRACAYMEAVWRTDTAAMAALLQHEPAEVPTATLLTELGENIMQWIFPAQFGIRGGLTAEELDAAAGKMDADPTVRVSRVLLETLKTLASDGTPENTETIARAVTGFLVAISDAATESDVMTMFDNLRQSALHGFGPRPE
ncbi:hypothetical protein AA958_19250 [Streptomyces sp. CNQ-509]|uniref:hypothetical protein n=1 Tax=Streptomyces sp. CNQ-509 TaxID=444103 RepID=UPI00062DD9D5|nr:hypothetical protein [Streptomyces sp. CNQ-509]AKH83968.1 hypothetical protein AA958_19250 [Streptomyces sp. CNQ-509]